MSASCSVHEGKSLLLFVLKLTFTLTSSTFEAVMTAMRRSGRSHMRSNAFEVADEEEGRPSRMLLETFAGDEQVAICFLASCRFVRVDTVLFVLVLWSSCLPANLEDLEGFQIGLLGGLREEKEATHQLCQMTRKPGKDAPKDKKDKAKPTPQCMLNLIHHLLMFLDISRQLNCKKGVTKIL